MENTAQIYSITEVKNRMRSNSASLFLLAFFIIFSTLSCAKEQPVKLKIGLSWIHEAQYAGMYWADQKGYYEEAGLIVEFIPYQYEDLGQALIDGKYDFVIMQSDTLFQAREKGLPVKAIWATYQLMPTCYFSKKAEAITKPEDFAGKTVGVAYSERYPLVAMLVNKGIDLETVNIVERNYDYLSLKEGQLDVEAGWITDGDTVEKTIGDYNVIHPYNYDVNWYADLIVTTNQRIQTQSNVVEDFLGATSRGWEEALVHEKEAALLTQAYDPGTNAEHLIFVLDISSPLIYGEQGRLGWIEEETLVNTQKFLLEQGAIQKKIAIKDAFTMDFLNRIYNGQ
ncbi:MAG: ABC transporter substrate-binding protein [Chloroflexi bacterium]|nr:ABC transporter substrate-binding protein [Chloroflexota bacterium]